MIEKLVHNIKQNPAPVNTGLIDKTLSINHRIPNFEAVVKGMAGLKLLDKPHAFCLAYGEKDKRFKRSVGRWNSDPKASFEFTKAIEKCTEDNGLLICLILESKFNKSELVCLDLDYEIVDNTVVKFSKNDIFNSVCEHLRRRGLNFYAEQSTKGVHLFFKRPSSLTRTTCIEVEVEGRKFKCDLKVNGYIALACNRQGELLFELPREGEPLSLLPDDFLPKANFRFEEKITTDRVGERNNNSYKRTISLLTKGLSKEDVWKIVFDENENREKPLAQAELKNLFNSALKSDLYESYLAKKQTAELDAGAIARSIFEENKDSFLIGPTELRGNESLFISSKGVLKNFSNSDLGNLALNYIPNVSKSKLGDIKVNLLALLNRAGKKISNWQDLEQCGVLLDNNGCVFNIAYDRIEVRSCSEHILDAGKPFRSYVDFAFNQFFIKLGYEAGNNIGDWEKHLLTNCPNWYSFLRETINVVDLFPFLEMIGNFFIPINSSFRRAFYFLVGPPECGKSVVLDYLTEHIKGIVPQVFDPVDAGNNFALAWLLTGTNRAVCNDGKRGYIKANDIFNALAEGGSLRVEGKGRDVTTIKRPICCIVATNHPPKSTDNSGAFESRYRPIVFFKKYSEKDSTLSEKLWSERNSFNNLALGRLFYLIKSKLDFSPTAANRNSDLLNQFSEEDPLGQFLQSCFEFTGLKSDKISTCCLTELLRNFCEEELGVESSDYIGQTGRLNPRSRKIIADYLKVKGAKTTLDRFGGSKVARGFYGVKIKEKDKEKIKEK